MSATFVNARSANGPRLAAWVETVVPSVPSNTRRYLRVWRDAPVHPSYYEADRVLIALGIHPSLVPPHVWRLAAPSVGASLRERACIVCGGQLSETHARDRNLCCGKPCADELCRRRMKPPPEFRTCAYCGEPYERPIGTSRSDWGKRRFCSTDCRILGTDSPWYRSRRKKKQREAVAA